MSEDAVHGVPVIYFYTNIIPFNTSINIVLQYIYIYIYEIVFIGN